MISARYYYSFLLIIDTFISPIRDTSFSIILKTFFSIATDDFLSLQKHFVKN